MAAPEQLSCGRCQKALNIVTAAKGFKDLRRCLQKRLAPLGFAVAGTKLWRKVNDTLVVLETQKDRYSTDEEARFTINLGISVDALRAIAAAAIGASLAEVPPPEACHWRVRLGRLLERQGDVWWSVRDEQTAQSVCDEIGSDLINVALPKVVETASSEALLRLWQEGHGQGLTEYEQRANLAKLLCALNRKDEAKKAIQALEDASLGKSWEVSARYDVKELRKQVA